MKKIFSFFPIILHEFRKVALPFANGLRAVDARGRRGEGNKKEKLGGIYSTSKFNAVSDDKLRELAEANLDRLEISKQMGRFRKTWVQERDRAGLIRLLETIEEVCQINLSVSSTPSRIAGIIS